MGRGRLQKADSFPIAIASPTAIASAPPSGFPKRLPTDSATRVRPRPTPSTPATQSPTAVHATAMASFAALKAAPLKHAEARGEAAIRFSTPADFLAKTAGLTAA